MARPHSTIFGLLKISLVFFVFGFLFFVNINKAEAAVVTWTGTSSSAWSNPANWSGGVAPVTGDNLVFPNGASNLSNTNDLTENTIFNSITFSGSGYTISGNPIILGAGLAGITDSVSSGGNTISLNIRLDVTRDIVVTNSTETLTISGTIAGVGGINKEGAGILALSGANTYGGATKINVGILSAQNNTALGTIAGDTEVVGGAALQLQGGINIGYEPLLLRGYGVSGGGALVNVSNNNTFGGLITLSSAGGTEIYSSSGTLTITGGMTGAFPLVIDGAGNVTYSTTAIATGTGIVTKNGTGTLTYNFPNTYTGLTTVNAGTLQYGIDNAILSGAVTVAGGTLNIGTYSDMVGTVTLGTLDGQAGTITGTSGVLSSASFVVYSGTISAIIAGDGGTLAKSTNATVTLTRPNQFTGAVTLTAGILDIQNSLALGTIDGTTTVSAGATLLIDGNGMTIPEFITINGTGLINAGAIENTNGNNDITGLITQAGASTIESDAGDTLTISTDGVTGAYSLTIDGTGNTTFDTGPIAIGTGGLIKDGQGTLTLQTFNPYTGTTTVDHGMLTLSGGGSIIQSTTMQINTDGAITVDNSSGQLDRLADTLALTLAGGNFNFYGSSSGNVLSIVGALTLSSAQNKINFYPGSGGYTILRFASLTRTAGASMLVRGANLGSAPGAGVSNLMFNTPPPLVGDDGAAGTPTVSILQGVFGDASTSGDGTDLTTYSDGNQYGLRLLNGAGFSNEYTTDITKTNANVRISSATPAVTTQINSLVLDTGASITDAGSPQTITFLSGNILNLASGTTIGGTNTTLAGGTMEFMMRMVQDATISANITTSGGVTKSGAGNLTLSTAQSYTSSTQIDSGTLTVGVANALPSASAITVDSSTLALGNFNDTVGAVTLQGGTITGGSGILIGSSYSLRDGTISAILGGSGTLTKINTNTNVQATVVLSGNNVFTGAVTITSGILQLGATGDGTNGPLGTTAGATTVASGASLDLNGYTLSTNEPLTISGTGIGARGAIINTSTTAATWNGNITLGAAARIGANFGNVTIGGGLSGAYALTVGGFSNINITGVISTITTVTKDGFGTYTPSNNNSYTGATTISAGTLKLGGVGNGTNSPIGTIAGTTTIALGARFDLNGYTLSTANPLTLNGVGYELGDFASGALMNSSASAVTYSGLITLGSASTIKADYGNINLTNAGTITGSGNGLTLGGAGTGSLSSIIGTVAGTVTKIGTGLWNLSGSSTYTGATTVNLGTLQLGAAGGSTNTPLGTTGTGTSVMTGAVLDLNGYTLGTAEGLTLNGRGISDGGALVNNSGSATGYSGAIVLATDSRITNTGAGLLTLTGGVTGAFALYAGGAGNTTFSTGVLAMGVGSLVKQGSGTVTNNGSATYTGNTRIDAGTFAYGASGLLAATNITVDGGIWDMDGVTDTVGTVTLIGGTIQNGTLTAATSYTLENGTISAILAGAIPVAKNTNGTVTLTGADTISSTTAINAGTLTLSGSGSAVSSTFTINLGGTLTLDNTTTAVASRLGDALALTMNGGNFNFIGNTSGASSETTGALTPASGHNVVTITPGAGGSTTMNFTSLARTAGATILFRGTSLGSTPAANVSTLMFTTTSPTLTGAGGAANSTTISVIKGAFGDSSLTGTGSDMVTYNTGNTNGLRLLNGAGFSGEYATNLATTSANVKLTGNVAASTASINSLILNGYGITNPGSAVTITPASASLAGNILINSATSIAGANTTLGITTYELDILATASSTISAIIGTATTGLVALSGGGNVTLSAANLYTGITYINNATLTYGVSNAISSGGVTMVGGTYNLAGNSDTVGSISINGGTITTGAGTLTGNGTFATVANNNVASIITGNLGLGANATFTINDGLMDNDAVISAVISGAYTFTKAGAGVLELSGSNTYTGLTTIGAGTIRLGATGGATNTPLGTTAAGTVVSSGYSLDLNGYTLGTAEALTISGTGIGANGAIMNTSSNAATYSGLITLGAAASITSNYGNINISNTGTITGATLGLTIGGAGNGSLSSILGTTTGTLTKNGLGLWNVSGASTFTGATTISAGTLQLGATGNSTNTPLGTTGAGTSITSGGILDLNGYTLGTAEALTINGTGLTSNAAVGALINNSSSATTYSGTITMGAASTVSNYGSGVLTLSGAISGSYALTTVTVGGITQSSASVWSGTGTLVKQGSGMLILAGQNSMTGLMTVSTGTLQVGANGGTTNTPLGTIAGGVTVSAGAVLDLSTFVVGGASTWEPLTLNGSGLDNTGALISSATSGNSFGALTVGSNSRVINSSSGIINFTGTVTIANGINLGVGGSGPTTISGAFGASATTATLTKWNSGTLLFSGTNPTTGLYRINGGTMQISSSTTLAVAPVTVAGGTLDINGTSESIGAVTIQNSGTITDSNGTPGVLTGTSYTFYGGAISAVLGGSAIAMAKSTGDALTVSKTFTNTGTLTINAGTVQYLANNIIADTAAVTIAGGTLDTQSYTDTLGTLTLTSGYIIGSGTLTGTSYAVASGTITANLAGAVALTKTTVGTVILSGTNTYTGITTIGGGTLSVGTIGNGGVAGNLGQATNAATNIVSSTGTGTLQYTGTTASTDRNITTTAAITLQIDVTNPSTVLTWNGGTTATTAPFTKIGMGTFVLAAATGHTGVTTVLGGTLQYGVANALSTGALTVSNGTFDINNYSDSVGIITLQNDGQIIDSSGMGTAVLTSTGAPALQSGTFSANLGGSTAISKTTSGRVILSGNNTFTSTTLALSAGYLNIQNNNALGASGTALTLTVTSGAVLELQGNITLPSTKSITASGTGVNNVGAIRNVSGSNTIGANLTLGASGVRVNSDSGTLTLPTVSGNTYNLIVGGAGNTTITGAITTTSGTLTKDGAGTLTLGGTNSFTGQLTVANGILSVPTVNNSGVAGPLGNSALGVILGSSGNTGTLEYTGGGTPTSSKNISLATSGTGALQIDTSGTVLTISGTITGSGGLKKTGAGQLTLGANETLGGTLTISQGTFDQGASYNLTTGGTLTVAGGATFNNTGTGSLTLGGNVSNAGTITIESNGSTSSSGTDNIVIATSDGATQRTWSGGGTFNIYNVTVSYQTGSITAYSSTDNGHNGWTFTTPGIIVSGGLYDTNGTSPLLIADTVKLSINGATALSTTSSSSDGTFSFAAPITNSGDILTLWISGDASNQGSLVFSYGSACTGTPNCTGLKITKNNVTLGSYDGTNVINSELANCNNTVGAGCSTTDIGFTSSPLVLTYATNTLNIPSGVTLAPGGNVTAQNVNIAGTYTGGSETLGITGTGTPLSVTGTFTANSDTVSFKATSSSVNVPTLSYNNLDFSPASGNPTFTPTTIGGGSSGWYSTGGTWNYRKAVTIDHTKISASQAPTLIAHTGITGNSTSAAINTTGANFIVVACHDYVSVSATVTDSYGNTWHPLTVYGSGSNTYGYVRLSYAYNATVGPGHTFTCNNGDQYEGITVSAYSGILSSGDPIDTGTDKGTTSSTSTIQPGSVTPSQSNELIISAWSSADSNVPTATIDSGFQTTNADIGDGGNMDGGMAYVVTTTTGASNPTWSLGTDSQNAAAIVAFKPAASTETYANFPVLVSLTDTDLKNNALSNGNDILFTDASGNKLNHEIENYNSSTGELEAWVNVGAGGLSNTADTTLYMYYGNASSSNQQNVSGTWNSAYQGVWHLGDAGGSTSKDSTTYGNNGTNNYLSSTTGQVDGAGSFNGSGGGNGSNIAIGGGKVYANNATPLSVSAWVNATNYTNNIPVVAELKTSGTGGLFFTVTNYSGSYTGVDIGSNDASWSNIKTGSLPSTGAWHHIVATYNGSGGTTMSNYKIYVDGTSQTLSAAGSYGDSNNASMIGAAGDLGSGNFWTGGLDELEISNSVLSPNWIATEYNNQNNPSSFYAVSNQQTANSTSLLSIANNLTVNSGTLTSAGSVTVSGGSATGNGVINMTGGTFTLNGTGNLGGTSAWTFNNLIIGGTTTATNANLKITGNLTNNGTLTNTGDTIAFAPSGTSNINGSNGITFNNFSVAGADGAGKTITFENGKTYAIAGAFNVAGQNGAPLSLLSASSGNPWTITMSGTSSINYLSVKDSACSGGNNVSTTDHVFNLGNDGSCWSFISIGGGGFGGGGVAPIGGTGGGGGTPVGGGIDDGGGDGGAPGSGGGTPTGGSGGEGGGGGASP